MASVRGSISVRRGMVFRGFFGVMFRLHVMAVRQVRMMAGLLVVARVVVVGGGAVMLRRVFVMLRCVAMVFSAFFRHGSPLFRKLRNGYYSRVSIDARNYNSMAAALQLNCTR